MVSTMRFLSIFFTLILAGLQFLLPSSAHGAVTVKPRHYILLVHGLHGTEKTFGALNVLLESHMRKVQSQYETKVFLATYPTTDLNKTTYDFSHDIEKKLNELFRERPIQKEDRISFVTHSQGGLVAWIWYLRSMANDPGYEKSHAYAERVDALVTLGSPLWGSRIATLVNNHSWLMYLGLKAKLFGKNEIKEMAHGSNTIQRFRYRAAEIDSQLNLQVRPLAIAGIIPRPDDPTILDPAGNLKISGRYVFMTEVAEMLFAGGQRLETDIAVDLPSVRSNFLYAISNKSKINFSDFKTLMKDQTNDLVVVDAPHMSWRQDQFYDIAEVPLDCIAVTKCTHPTYPYLLKHLLNCDQNYCENSAWEKYVLPLQTTQTLGRHNWKDIQPDQLSSFMLDVEVELPEGIDRELVKKEATLYFPNQDENGRIDFKSYQVAVGSKNDWLSHFQHVAPAVDSGNVPSINKKEFLRFTYYGRINSDDKSVGRLQAGYRLPFYVVGPGLPRTYVEANVRTTFSTFVSIRR